MSANTNRLLKRIEADDVALGFIVRMVTGRGLIEVALASGHDFIYLDTQHELFSEDTVKDLISQSRLTDLATLVRVRSSNDPNMTVYLDAGASGILVPDVNTAAQAQHVVERCKYPPIGARSFPGPQPTALTKPMSVREAMALSNTSTIIACMIETREGLDNVAAIAAVDGVDILHIGCTDLLIALGKEDEPGCSELADAIHRVGEAARVHGKVLGIGGDRNPQRRSAYVRAGARFMTTDIDSNLFLNAATSLVADIRKLHQS